MARGASSRVESRDQLFVLANREWDSGKPGVAFKLFLRAAAAGHASAKNSVGYFLDHGLGTRKNAAEAMLWYRRAARQGDLSAYSNIAINYKNAGNVRRAKIWFSRALENGDASSGLELAKLLLATKRKSESAKVIRHLRNAVKSRHISEEDRKEARQLLRDVTSP
jgi:TPR repeat protein